MPKHFFYQVHAIFIGPNPEVGDDCGGAYVSCIVEAPDQVSAIESLITDLKGMGFFYECFEEVMTLETAIERFGLDPEWVDAATADEIAYDTFHCYSRKPQE